MEQNLLGHSGSHSHLLAHSQLFSSFKEGSSIYPDKDS
jgi:hypothetical protein